VELRVHKLLGFKPQILHKVLAVVVLPIVLELGLNLQLYQLVTRAEAMAQAERQQSEIVDHINTLTFLFANAGGSIASYSVTGSVGYLKTGKDFVDQFRKEMSELMRLSAIDPDSLKAMQEFNKLAEAEFAQLYSVGPPEAGTNYDQAVTSIRGLRSMIKQANVKSRIIMRLSISQKERLATIRAREEASRRQVKEIILWGNILTLFLAAGLIALLIRHINGRLGLLVQNARILPTGHKLPNRVRGGDELAYLDKVMHTAAAELGHAASHREQIMQMVAHDLRSPLMSSQISLEILTSDKVPTPPPGVSKHIFGVKHNIALLVGLVNDLLTIDKLEAGKLEIAPEHFLLDELVIEAMQTIEGLAQRREMIIANRCGARVVCADRQRILQVLINYLSNAIKFSPKQSQIIVDDDIDKTDSDMVIVRVQDEGPGVSAEVRKQLFQRFYQTDTGKQSQGFGLGLAICKLIVETHEGRVGVDNVSGATGSIFWFTVPLGDSRRLRQ
jgi:signal transduction histidine kinase